MGNDRNPAAGDSAAGNAAERQAQTDAENTGAVRDKMEDIIARDDARRLERKHGLGGGSHPDSRNPISDKGDGW